MKNIGYQWSQFECSVHLFRGPWLRSQITMADEAIIRLHLQPETEIQSILRVPLSEAMVAFVEKWGFVLQQHLVMQNQIWDLQLGFNQPLDLPHQIILQTGTHLSFCLFVRREQEQSINLEFSSMSRKQPYYWEDTVGIDQRSGCFFGAWFKTTFKYGRSSIPLH